VYTCPVCGYDRLTEAPAAFTICPSCGTEFEYDDASRSYADLRRVWLGAGARWWSTVDPAPANWDPQIQVNRVLTQVPTYQVANIHLFSMDLTQPQCPASLPSALGAPRKQAAEYHPLMPTVVTQAA
jgi:hypothetical protein